MAERCAFHVWEGPARDEASDATARHLCPEHYGDWRDGERTGPAFVQNTSECRRRCQACRDEEKADQEVNP